MNLLHELKPYDSELDAWKRTGKLPHNLQPLILIYQKLWQERPDIGGYNVKTNCASCVSDMTKALYNCREEERKKGETYFKGVPEVKKITPTEVIEIEGITEDGEKVVVGLEIDLSKMKWGELRKYATSQGINVKGKNKETILKELEELNG